MNRHVSASVFLTVFLLQTITCSASADESSIDQSRFEATVICTGLTRPMEIAVASDGSVFFIELDGPCIIGLRS